MLGNLLADFMKGPDLSSFPPEVQEGIKLHRLIDGFTDRHALVQRSITRLSANWGWFSGIIIDIYYDHFLAIDFDCYSPEPLQLFVDRVHQVLRDHWEMIPPDAHGAIEKLIETNRLATYATREGIEDTLFRVSQRIRERMPKRPVNLELAMPELLEKHEALREDFVAFFPELMEFARAHSVPPF